MNSDAIGVGVIGAGAIGRIHALNLATRVLDSTVAAVMDVDRERAEALAAKSGATRIYSDASALIHDPAIDAVLIASPDATHAQFTLECIRAGKHVLCEKPLATSREDAERVIAAETTLGRRLSQVGFMREYDPAHVAVFALVESGAIGQLLKFRGVHINPKYGGDLSVEEAIVNSVIHDIHSARFMMGAEISRVQVEWVPADAEQPRSCRLMLVQLAFDNGAIGALEWNGDSGYGYEVNVEITGETGAASTASHASPVIRQSGLQSQAITSSWPERFARAYVIEVQDWIRAVQRNESSGPSAWDGYMSLVVADACIRSSVMGLPTEIEPVERPAFYR